jgi:hypothetical protein
VEKALWLSLVECFGPIGSENDPRGRIRCFTLVDIAKIFEPQWVFGKIDSEEVQSRLESIGEDGCFLVRISSSHGFLTISAMLEEEIFHWRVGVEKNQSFDLVFCTEGKSFPSLSALIENFKNEPLPTPKGGCTLRKSCKKPFLTFSRSKGTVLFS